jgi:hypothetical protein
MYMLVFIRAVCSTEIRNFDGSDSDRRMFLISVKEQRMNTNIFSVKHYLASLIFTFNMTYVCGSDRNIRPSGTRPWAVTPIFRSEPQASLPPNGRVTSGRIFRSEPQHMTDIINHKH